MEQNDGLWQALDSMAGEATEYFQKARLLQERMAGITGTAVTDDGYIRVTWRDGGIDGLEINPRAMRMGSADLAETILRLSQEARADSRRQSDAVMSDLFGEQNPAGIVADKEGLQESIDMMRDVFTGAIGDSKDLIDRLQRRFHQG
ncbi:YbaB/EbfC family nucleoid-associated protein [Actinoallomurus sp. NPDC052274]|uniref:YbaB/EbfC family nucleoid-associated protein n=1 Tax=Actinoallomurus sp. NPDC052274 TaxID=3155420 RepID=UPI00341B1C8A